jgi:hypothetical protein
VGRLADAENWERGLRATPPDQIECSRASDQLHHESHSEARWRQSQRLLSLSPPRARFARDRQWAPITLVSQTLGHADLKTTSVYAPAAEREFESVFETVKDQRQVEQQAKIAIVRNRRAASECWFFIRRFRQPRNIPFAFPFYGAQD